MQRLRGSIRWAFLWVSLVAGLSMFLLLAPYARADFEPTVEKGIDEQDRELEEGRHTHLGRGPIDIVLEPYDALREKAKESLGLDWFVAYSYLYQHRSEGGNHKWTNNSELDVLFTWDLVDHDSLGRGSLTGMFSRVWEHRNGATTAEVTESAGTSFAISDSDKIEALRQFYWTQSLQEDRYQVHLGQIEVPTFIDDNSYSNNDRDSFAAETWLKGTRSTVNIFGLGAVASVQPSDLFYLRAGFVDGNTNLENPKFSTFKRGEYVYVGEVGLTPDIEGWGPGIYRISPWYADKSKTGKQGKGLSVSFEQETQWDAALWLRGGISDNRRNNFESFLGGGVVFTNPFGFDRDQIGMAIGWGRPDDGSARDNTYLAETYWRAQLTERLEFGPDLQLHIKPAEKRSRDLVAVAGLRAMVRF